jgi:DNA-binding NtrC family response regulator
MRKECRKQGLLLKELSPALKDMLQQYNWPGNVAELKAVVEKAVLYSPKAHIITELGSKTTPVLDLAQQGGCGACRPGPSTALGWYRWGCWSGRPVPARWGSTRSRCLNVKWA